MLAANDMYSLQSTIAVYLHCTIRHGIAMNAHIGLLLRCDGPQCHQSVMVTGRSTRPTQLLIWLHTVDVQTHQGGEPNLHRNECEAAAMLM